jgi:retinol-binding protein 3
MLYAIKTSIMKIINSTLPVLVFILLISNYRLLAQEDQTTLTAEEKNIIVDSIGSKLKSTYVFPEVAREMSIIIEKNLKKDKYQSISDPFEFAKVLTEDLISISHDKHIKVMFDPQALAARGQEYTHQDSVDNKNNYIAGLKRDNFGFKQIRILDGNIGYLDLRSFSDVDYGESTAVSAMNFLSNSDAIIIDLRMNGGGSPMMIQLITSYLFDSKPIHLNNFYWRPTDSQSQTWTLSNVEGTRSPKTPVFVLTSKSTFSAAEEFSYNLKNLKRATLIGETTGGGAHPGGPVNATDKFIVWIPSGRAINPITNTNWEGTGVTPHIDVPSNQALEVAQIKALEFLLENSKDEQLKKIYEWNLSGLKVLLEPVIIEKTVLEYYIGTYGPGVISIENNTLHYQKGEGNKYELIPLNKNEFMLKELSSFRIRFIIENGQIAALEVNYDNGSSDKNLKNKE